MPNSMWIIFVVLFAFAESIPITNENNYSHAINFTKELNFGLSTFFQFLKLNRSSLENDRKIIFENNTNNGTLYDVTFELELKLPFKLDVLPNYSFTIYGEITMTYFKARLQNTNYYVVSYPQTFNLDYMINQAISSDDNFTVKYPDFSHNDVKRTEIYEVESDQIVETQIKQEIEINLKNALREVMQKNKLGRNSFNQWFLKNFGEFLQNKQERYYFIDEITTSNYTLNNVTIEGLWNIESISINLLNPETYSEIVMSHIRGSTLFLNYLSNPHERLKLHFQADNIHLSMDRYLDKVKVMVKKCSVVNTESNTTLADDQWKLILNKIESTIANSIESNWKN